MPEHSIKNIIEVYYDYFDGWPRYANQWGLAPTYRYDLLSV